MTVPEALATAQPLQSIGKRATKQELRTLIEDGKVGRTLLYGTRSYYYRTSRPVATYNGDSRARIGPLSELAKIRSYSMLAFCRLSGTMREKLTSEQLSQRMPELSGGGKRDNYYVQTTRAAKQYGHALIDAGTHGRWDRILGKLREDVRYHSHFDSIQSMRKDQPFEWSLLTVTPQKAARLQDAMRQMPELRGVQVRVCAIPELIYLIAPPAC